MIEIATFKSSIFRVSSSASFIFGLAVNLGLTKQIKFAHLSFARPASAVLRQAAYLWRYVSKNLWCSTLRESASVISAATESIPHIGHSAVFPKSTKSSTSEKLKLLKQ